MMGTPQLFSKESRAYHTNNIFGDTTKCTVIVTEFHHLTSNIIRVLEKKHTTHQRELGVTAFFLSMFYAK